MVVAGVGVAAYALPWGATAPVASDPLDEIQAPRVTHVIESPPVPTWQTTYAPSASEPPPAISTSVTVPTAKRVAMADVPARMPIARSESGVASSSDKAGLTREIQRQLKRVGCYDGDVTGVWSPNVRRAMKSFTDRMNATLPTDEPDFVLLAMVESHGSRACGRPCEHGQADTTQCVPSTVVTTAARARPSSFGSDNPQAALPASGAITPLEGRMALAGPKTEAADPATVLAPESNLPAGDLPKTATRVDKWNATPQRRDRDRNRSAAGRPLPSWATPRAMP
jgi:hypothetical protein